MTDDLYIRRTRFTVKNGSVKILGEVGDFSSKKELKLIRDWFNVLLQERYQVKRKYSKTVYVIDTQKPGHINTVASFSDNSDFDPMVEARACCDKLNKRLS